MNRWRVRGPSLIKPFERFSLTRVRNDCNMLVVSEVGAIGQANISSFACSPVHEHR